MNKDKALFRLEREKLLLTGEIPRLFMKYALPGVAGLLFLGIQSVIDGIVLGRFVGANALASVNLVLPCYSLISAFAIVMGIGGQTLVSISLGRGDKQEANDALRSVFVFLLGMSVVVSLVIFLSAGKIASFLGANEVLLPDAVLYTGARSFLPAAVCDVFRRLHNQGDGASVVCDLCYGDDCGSEYCSGPRVCCRSGVGRYGSRTGYRYCFYDGSLF